MLGYLGYLVFYKFSELYQNRSILCKLSKLRNYYSMPSANRKSLQEQKARRIIEYAAATVPYYRELFSKISFDPAKLKKDISFIKDIPLLTKDDIREHNKRLLSEAYKGPTHARKTGGSTGAHVTIYYGRDDLDWTAAVNLLVTEWAGRKPWHREMHFASEFFSPIPFKDKLREHFKTIAMNRVNVFTSSLDDRCLHDVYNKIERFRPFLIQCHPSTMYNLALYLSANKIRSAGIFKVFESTGELLTERQADVIKNIFRCRIYNRFGNAEFGVVAYGDGVSYSDLLILDNVVFAESLGLDGENEIVLTGLQNYCMPLIRYRTGDLGTVYESPSGCRLTDIYGRIHDTIQVNGKSYPTHFIQDLIDRIDGVNDFQVVVTPSGKPQLRLVLRSHELQGTVSSRLGQWLGNEFEINFIRPEDLILSGRRSKFRHVVVRS